jgi:hypothetical protein
MSDVDVLINAKLEGLAAFEEAKAGVNRIKEAIDTFRAAEAAGFSVDRAMNDTLSDLGSRAIVTGATIDEMRKQITDARQALVHYSEAVAGGMPIDAAQAAVLADVAEGYRQEARAATEATAAQDAATPATAAASAAAGAGAPGWIAMAVGIGIAVMALAPFLSLIVSAAVILVAFAVAGAGTLILLGGLAAGFLAIGAAVVALGGGGAGALGASAALATATENLSKAQETLQEFDAAHPHPTLLQAQTREQDVENIAAAQQKYNDALAAANTPVAILVAQLAVMKDTLAAQAAPLAAIITQWVGGAIPAVTALGQSFMDWFGDRLRFVLVGIQTVLTDLGPTFAEFARFLGGVFDAKVGSIGPIIELGIKLAIRAIEGLITNLVALSNWFEQRLPLYGPIVSQIFGFIGGVIQGIAQVWGSWADWLANNWPTIVAIAQLAIKSIGDEWNKWWPQLKPLIENALPAFGILLVQIATNAGGLVPFLMLIFTLFMGFALAVMTVVAAVMTLLTWLGNLQLWIDAHHPTFDFLTGGQGGNSDPRTAAGNRSSMYHIPAAAGYSGMVRSPTLFLAGEAGDEHVQITPGQGAGGHTINVHVYGSVQTERGLALTIREAVRRLDREQR